MRIVFLTVEFPTEVDNAGGLGSYLHRIVRVVRDVGHVPEVITISSQKPEVLDAGGVRVERVPMAERVGSRALRCLGRLPTRIGPYSAGVRERQASALGAALLRRESQVQVDLVQSSNFGLTGLFVPRRLGRVHIVRCSSATLPLAFATRVIRPLDALWTQRLENRCLQHADRVYSPSENVANYYRRWLGIDVAVIRPPLFIEADVASVSHLGLPSRFLLYFGLLCRYKGTDVLARALPLVWKQEPSFRMVWAGTGSFRRYAARWAPTEGRVQWLGALPKPLLYGVLSKAVASVIPSRCDNLPNTALESLSLGIPVIGSMGASLDEVVEPGRSGETVPIGDHRALADAMLRAWRNDHPWPMAGFSRPKVFDEMEPKRAAEKLLRFAQCGCTRS